MQTKQVMNEPTNQTPFYGDTDRANLLSNDWQMAVSCMTSYRFSCNLCKRFSQQEPRRQNICKANSTYLDVIWDSSSSEHEDYGLLGRVVK
jgi:hypothetical protein